MSQAPRLLAFPMISQLLNVVHVMSESNSIRNLTLAHFSGCFWVVLWQHFEMMETVIETLYGKIAVILGFNLNEKKIIHKCIYKYAVHSTQQLGTASKQTFISTIQYGFPKMHIATPYQKLYLSNTTQMRVGSFTDIPTGVV